MWLFIIWALSFPFYCSYLSSHSTTSLESLKDFFDAQIKQETSSSWLSTVLERWENTPLLEPPRSLAPLNLLASNLGYAQAREPILGHHGAQRSVWRLGNIKLVALTQLFAIQTTNWLCDSCFYSFLWCMTGFLPLMSATHATLNFGMQFLKFLCLL